MEQEKQMKYEQTWNLNKHGTRKGMEKNIHDTKPNMEQEQKQKKNKHGTKLNMEPEQK